MAQRYYDPRARELDGNGNPLSGGKLYFYVPGTAFATPKDTYSDNALTTPNSNPVILSQGGIAPNIFYDGSYDVILQNSDGVQIWSATSVNSVVSSPFAEWDATIPYGEGGTNIVYGSDGNYYISIQPNNTAHDPVSNPLWWSLWPFPSVAKGVIYAGTGTAVVAVGPGANGDALVADSGEAAGVKFETPVAAIPTGTIIDYAGITIPANYLACDGSAVSRATYANLFAALTASKGAFTVTIAAPGLITLASHGLETGDVFSATTTGALPTGLSASTNYWFIKNDANTGWFATTYANAFAGTKVATSGSQSGVHTLRLNPWGISGASDFLLPDLRRKTAIGSGGLATATIGNRVGNAGGEENHALTETENGPHTHTLSQVGYTTWSGVGPAYSNGVYNNTTAPDPFVTTNPTAGSGVAHNTMQPSAVVMKIIKT